ncbi:hypothetical protein D9M68_864720 [compost metagenome]
MPSSLPTCLSHQACTTDLLSSSLSLLPSRLSGADITRAELTWPISSRKPFRRIADTRLSQATWPFRPSSTELLKCSLMSLAISSRRPRALYSSPFLANFFFRSACCASLRPLVLRSNQLSMARSLTSSSRRRSSYSSGVTVPSSTARCMV